MDKLLRKLNGVVLPGGDADVGDSGYERISKQSIAFSKKLAKKNITFPVLGICRGAQMMMMAEAGKDFLEETDSLNLSLPLKFTSEAKESRLFGHAPQGMMKSLAKDALTFNAHAMGIPTLNFYNNSKRQKAFRAISTNYDRNGTKFISTFEGKYSFEFILANFYLTLSWRRSPSYRNQSIGLHSTSVDWFLYNRDVLHERDTFHANIIKVMTIPSSIFSQLHSHRMEKKEKWK